MTPLTYTTETNVMSPSNPILCSICNMNNVCTIVGVAFNALSSYCHPQVVSSCARHSIRTRLPCEPTSTDDLAFLWSTIYYILYTR